MREVPPIRVPGIDAARGVAMVLVCLSHFATTVLYPQGALAVGRWLVSVSMVATPTFVLLAGLLLGLSLHAGGSALARRRRQLVDRGVFLVTVGHVLLLVASVPPEAYGSSLFQPFVTDAIGFSMLVGSQVTERVSMRSRAILATSLYVTSMAAALLGPSAGAVGGAKALLVGAGPSDAAAYSFPLLPWLAVYLLASVLGQLFAGRVLDADRSIRRPILQAGVAAVALAVLVRLAVRTLVAMEWLTPGASAALTFLGSPWQKSPPGPLYLLFFGGIALVILAEVFALARRPGLHARVLRPFEVIGRASLAVFVVQQFMYFTILRQLHVRYTPAWPVIFLGTVAGLYLFAAWWHRRELNRCLTVRPVVQPIVQPIVQPVVRAIAQAMQPPLVIARSLGRLHRLLASRS